MINGCNIYIPPSYLVRYSENGACLLWISFGTLLLCLPELKPQLCGTGTRVQTVRMQEKQKQPDIPSRQSHGHIAIPTDFQNYVLPYSMPFLLSVNSC